MRQKSRYITGCVLRTNCKSVSALKTIVMVFHNPPTLTSSVANSVLGFSINAETLLVPNRQNPPTSSCGTTYPYSVSGSCGSIARRTMRDWSCLAPTSAAPWPQVSVCYPTALFGVTCCTGRGGTFEKSEPSPSAIVGCARTASRSFEYGRSAGVARFTPAKTSPAAGPHILEPGNQASFPPTRAFFKP